ncbi:MAG: MFS transporter [Sphingorhabdus sp.]
MLAGSDLGRSEWRNGWPVLVASAIGCGMVATHAITLGSFVVPLTHEFGWTRAQITAGLSFGSLGTIFLSPLLGRLLDWTGARRVALVGVPLYAIALALLGLVEPSILSWYGAWACLAILSMGMSPVIWTLAVASRFERNRGFALALVLAGLSLASAVMPLVAVTAIEAWGWRAAYWSLSALALILVWPLTFAFFYDRSDLARSGQPHEQGNAPPLTMQASGFSVRQALSRRQFWQIVVALTLVGGCYNAIYQHFQPMLIDAGLDALGAAAIAGIIGPISFASRLLTGFLLDRVPAPFVAAPAFALPIVTCILLSGFDGSSTTAMIAIACTAMAAGAEVDLIAFLAARYFGMRSYGAIYGLIFSAHTIGWAIMPIVAGITFGRSGNYDSILFFMVGMLALSATLAATLGRYPALPVTRDG